MRIPFVMAMVTVGVWAQAQQLPAIKLGLGGDLALDPLWGTVRIKQNDSNYTDTVASFTYLSLGAHVDFTYGFARVAYAFSLGKPKTETKATVNNNTTTTIIESEGTVHYLILSAFGRFPFVVLSRPSVLAAWPFLGIEYFLNTEFRSGNIKKSDLDSDSQADLNELFITLGGGVDYDVAKQVYLRGMLGFGINLLSGNSALKKQAEQNNFEYSSSGFRLFFSFGAGYRF